MTNRMKILVAYDGSECADAALDDMRMAGLPTDAQIKVLSVVENWLPPPSGLEIIEHIDRDQEYLALARRGSLRLVSMEPGWDVMAESGAGAPATVIIEKADEWGADLIVVGSQGERRSDSSFSAASRRRSCTRRAARCAWREAALKNPVRRSG
jgi:nucleotide-binding universal stress UspA family protein